MIPLHYKLIFNKAKGFTLSILNRLNSLLTLMEVCIGRKYSVSNIFEYFRKMQFPHICCLLFLYPVEFWILGLILQINLSLNVLFGEDQRLLHLKYYSPWNDLDFIGAWKGLPQAHQYYKDHFSRPKTLSTSLCICSCLSRNMCHPSSTLRFNAPFLK